MKMQTETDIVIVAKCVACGAKREIEPGEVVRGDLPECRKCHSFMVAERAKSKRRKP